MKKKSIMLVVLLITSLIVGCGASYDEEGYSLVNDYFKEMSKEIDRAYLNILSMDPYNLEPEIGEYSVKIQEINENYWEDGIFCGRYSDEDIKKWAVKMTRGETEWIVDGEELLDALLYMHLSSGWLASDIDRTLQEGTEENLRFLVESLEVADKSVLDLKKILLNL